MRRLMVTTFVVGLFAIVARAEEVQRTSLQISVGKTLLNDVGVGDRPTNIAENREVASAMRAFIDVQFAEIQRVCKPSKGQLANLQTAADAAVDSAMEQWIERSKRNPKGTRGVHLDRSAALKHRIWVEAVNGLLSHSQKRQLELSQQSRTSFLEKAKGQPPEELAHSQAIARLDAELLLEPSQRDRVAELLKTNAGRVKLTQSKRVDFSKGLAKQIVAQLTGAQKAKWKELTKKAYDSALEIHVE